MKKLNIFMSFILALFSLKAYGMVETEMRTIQISNHTNQNLILKMKSPTGSIESITIQPNTTSKTFVAQDLDNAVISSVNGDYRINAAYHNESYWIGVVHLIQNGRIDSVMDITKAIIQLNQNGTATILDGERN